MNGKALMKLKPRATKTDYAKKGWITIFASLALYFTTMTFGIIFQLVNEDWTLSIDFFKFYYIALVLISVLSIYFFACATIRQKSVYLFLLLFSILIFLYSVWGAFEAFTPYPFD